MTKSSKKSARRRPHQDFTFTGKSFTAHAVAIGQAVMAWNYLHEVLRGIFRGAVSSMGRPDQIWYSAAFDRPRREMLRAIVQSVPPEFSSLVQQGITEIGWILAEADKLENVRNDMIHAPLVLVSDEMATFLKTRVGVVPQDWDGNPRAKRLSQKDLLSEFRWFRDSAMVLAAYAKAFNSWPYLAASLSFPQRPRLPNRGQKKIRQRRSRQLPAK